MKIVLLGAPGTGKGTMAFSMSRALSLPHISTGDLFRFNIAEGTELGHRAKQYLDSGKLVPDEITIGMVKERLAEGDCREGFLLDGFPRTVPQAVALDEVLKLESEELDLVLNLQVPEELIFRRITNRLVCSACGKPYNKLDFPPVQEGVCDTCGGPVIQRRDDTAETLRTRLDTYYELTDPLVTYYQEQGILLNHDNSGTHTPDQVDSLITKIKEQIKLNRQSSATAISQE
ncbi:MAG: adenylate kinase [Clostridiaceae bacterium]|nr:adenylate kinase [Clostridiaceae bacterium]